MGITNGYNGLSGVRNPQNNTQAYAVETNDLLNADLKLGIKTTFSKTWSLQAYGLYSLIGNTKDTSRGLGVSMDYIWNENITSHLKSK